MQTRRTIPLALVSLAFPLNAERVLMHGHHAPPSPSAAVALLWLGIIHGL